MMQGLERDTLIEADGWAALDLSEFDRMNVTEREQALIVAGHFQNTFTMSEQGKFILRLLVEQYLLQRIVQPGDDEFAAGIRQGQADVVRFILRQIEIARTGGAPT